MLRPRHYCAALALALLTHLAVGGAAETPAYGPAADWVTPQAIPAAPAAPSAASVRTLLVDTQANLTATVSETYSDTVVLVQTPQGVAEAANISLAWSPQTENVTVHRLRILRAGQEIDLLGPGQTFTLLHPDDEREVLALGGRSTAVFKAADLRVGDQLEFAYSLRRRNALPGSAPEQILGVPPALEPLRMHLRARWPADRKLTWKASRFITPLDESHAAGFTQVATTRSNDPPLIQPLGAPARFLLDRALQVSGYPSWAAVSKLLAPLFAQAARLSAASPLQAQLTRIRAATADPRARAQAALRLVQDQIRYVPVAMNDAPPIPADADTTWARRYGDSKAQTALLLALLQGLGIDAEPVAATSIAGDALAQRLPMIQWFNHVLVRASIDGSTYWLDGTRSGDRRLEDLPVPNVHWGLPLRAAGADLMKIEPAALEVPTEETTFTIDASAGASVPAALTIESRLRGEVALSTQQALSRLSEAQRDTALRTYWRQQAYLAKDWTAVKLFEVKATFDDATGQLQLSAQGQGNLTWQQGQHHLGALAMGRVVDLQREPGPNADAPYLVAFPTFARVTERIKLPNAGAGFAIIGTDVERTIAGIHYARSARITAGELVGAASVRSLQPEFPAAEAGSAQVALRALSEQSVFVKLPPTAGAAALSR